MTRDRLRPVSYVGWVCWFFPWTLPSAVYLLYTNYVIILRNKASLILVIYHLPKSSGNFSQNVNVKTILARHTGKFSEKKTGHLQRYIGRSKFSVEISKWKMS